MRSTIPWYLIPLRWMSTLLPKRWRGPSTNDFLEVTLTPNLGHNAFAYIYGHSAADADHFAGVLKSLFGTNTVRTVDMATGRITVEQVGFLIRTNHQSGELLVVFDPFQSLPSHLVEGNALVVMELTGSDQANLYFPAANLWDKVSLPHTT